MTRKRALGCMAAVLLVLVAASVFFYITVFRPAERVMADLDRMAELREMNARLADRSAFVPPRDGRLTPDALARFARVQSAMQAGLGSTYPFLAERARRLHGLLPGEEGKIEAKRLGLREAILALEGLGPVLHRAKELQVSALNAEGFSLGEYRWVRETFYRGLGFSRVNVYFEEFAASLEKAGKPPDPPAVSRPLEANVELAAAYSDSAQAWFPFLVFGF
jgi:hypothetical protein